VNGNENNCVVIVKYYYVNTIVDRHRCLFYSHEYKNSYILFFCIMLWLLQSTVYSIDDIFDFIC